MIIIAHIQILLNKFTHLLFNLFRAFVASPSPPHIANKRQPGELLIHKSNADLSSSIIPPKKHKFLDQSGSRRREVVIMNGNPKRLC